MTESITVEGRGVKINARGLAAVAVVVGLALVAGQAYGVGEVGDDTRAAADDVRADIAEVQADVSALQADVARAAGPRSDAAASRGPARTDAAIIRVEAWLSGRDGQPLDSAERTP
jgi:hypothetical protein